MSFQMHKMESAIYWTFIKHLFKEDYYLLDADTLLSNFGIGMLELVANKQHAEILG